MSGFDLKALHNAVDVQRTDTGLSWAALSKQVGVSASTIRRFKSADDAEADGVLALIRWVGVAPETFIAAASAGALLGSGDGSYVRVDMALVAKANGERVGKQTRTTIQRLVATAQESGQPIAALTRMSDA